MSDNALVPYQEMSLQDTMRLGQTLAQSGYFSDAKQAAQAVVKVLAGRELGFGPVASMTGVYIVKSRVTLSANLIAAAVKRTGVYNYRIKRHDAQACRQLPGNLQMGFSFADRLYRFVYEAIERRTHTEVDVVPFQECGGWQHYIGELCHRRHELLKGDDKLQFI